MQRTIRFFTRLVEAWIPDAFVFCLLLTLVVFLGAWSFTHHGPLMLLDFWQKDFWSLNGFAMQMIFVLITGHMLATTPFISKILETLAARIHHQSQALLVISLFSIVSSWINWGFGLIVSGILAVNLARKLGKVNFPLFVAAAYSGFLVWHGGLSGSIPLKIAGQDEILSRIYPGLTIPLGHTLFSPLNLTLLGALLLVLPLLTHFLQNDELMEVKSLESNPLGLAEGNSLRDRLEHSRILNLIFFGFFGVVFIQGLLTGAAFDINRVNLIFLFLAILLHGTPRRFLEALKDSFGNASGIAIQFPFYAGLMGLMQHSGLADQISSLFVSWSSVKTLPVLTFLSGGLVNFFVPSGGGQWVVQGPIMLKAAQDLGADPAKIAMALAWGDAWTNMIQPFWALPLLALAKLELKDIMGYCLMYLLVSGVLISSILYWF